MCVLYVDYLHFSVKTTPQIKENEHDTRKIKEDTNYNWYYMCSNSDYLEHCVSVVLDSNQYRQLLDFGTFTMLQ